MIAFQSVPENQQITEQYLSDLIGAAMWWAENKGPVILFCNDKIGYALIEEELDEFWVDILPFPDGELNPEITPIGLETAEIPPEVLLKIKQVCEKMDSLNKLLKPL